MESDKEEKKRGKRRVKKRRVKKWRVKKIIKRRAKKHKKRSYLFSRREMYSLFKTKIFKQIQSRLISIFLKVKYVRITLLSQVF